MTEKDQRSDYSNHQQRDQFPHMKRDQRNRNERGRLAVKIVCGAIASLLAGAFAASELFALSTRFSPSLGEHYLYLYPPWAIASSTLTMGAMKQSPRPATCRVRLHPTASKPLNTFQSSAGKPPW